MCDSVKHHGHRSHFGDRSLISWRCPVLRRVGICVLVALLLVPVVVQAQPMRWPEAVAALAAERTRAETCVRLLKRHAGNDDGRTQPRRTRL